MKVVAEAKNCHIRVEERVGKKEKVYKMLVANVNGKDVDLCFHNVYVENALLRAGVKFSEVK